MRKWYFVLIGLLPFLWNCSGATVPVRRQQYAELSRQKTYESDFKTVWKAIEDVFRNHKIVDRNPEVIEQKEWNKIASRTLTTDWIQTTSRDKYVEYQVNGSPRRKELRLRVRYVVSAIRQIGGVQVTVLSTEEEEHLFPDGSSDGYHRSEETDSSRAAEILEQIFQKILQ